VVIQSTLLPKSAQAQDPLRRALIANHGIQHGVINHGNGPFNMEVLLNEIGTFAIDGIDKFFSFFFTFSAFEQALNFVFTRSVKKYAQRLGSVI
jgi:hypothetical protein